MTLRMEGHAVHDDAFYVPKDMFEEWAKHDPVERFRTWLQENADLRERRGGRARGTTSRSSSDDAIKRAEESPLPGAETLTEGVYAAPEDLDTPHHK